MIEVTYRFKSDPEWAKSTFRCDKPQQYDTFMEMYGHNIEVISDSTKSYDSPVAMPIFEPWWYGPGDHALLRLIPKDKPMTDQERYIELKAAVEYFLMVQGGVRAIADHGVQLTDSLWQQYFRAVEDLERLVGWNDDEEEQDEL